MTDLSQTSQIIYCNGCNQPKIICACAVPGDAPAESNNNSQDSKSATALLFEKLILNAYQALTQKEKLFAQGSADSSGIMQADGVILDSLTKLTRLEFTSELSPFDKLVELLKNLKSNNMHPDVAYQIEKIEHQLKEYLQKHPDQMRPELAYLLDKQESKSSLKSKPTPFNTKPLR